jgi:hypothetical protein
LRLQGKQARAEEFGPSSTIHCAFERFQTIDLSFRLAVAPRLSDRISHRVDVSLRRASETLHRVQARFLGVSQPGAEPTNALAFRHAPESHGESTHCRELWPVHFHHIDLCGLIDGQQSTLSAAATIGEIERPVAGSTVRGFGTADVVFTVLHLGLRHFASSRSRFEKLPV